MNNTNNTINMNDINNNEYIDCEIIVEARGLSSFLSRLPQSVVDNLLVASNIPPRSTDILHGGIPKLLHIKTAEQDLKRWASAPNLQHLPTFPSENNLYELSASGKSIEHDYHRPASVPLIHTHSHSTASSPSEYQHFFIPLLHVLPETQSTSALVKYNTCRRIVKPIDSVSISSTHSAQIFVCESLDIHGDDISKIVSSSELVSSQEPILSPSNFTSSPDDEYLVQLPTDALPNLSSSHNANTTSIATQKRSAFQAIMETLKSKDIVRPASASSDIGPEQIYKNTDEYFSRKTMKLPNLSFSRSQKWLHDPKHKERTLKYISNSICIQKGPLKIKEINQLHSIYAKANNPNSQWKKYFAELRNGYLFLYEFSKDRPSYSSVSLISPIDILSNKDMYPIGYIPLKRAYVDIAYTLTKHKNALRVVLGKEHLCLLRAPSEAEMIGWAHVLRLATVCPVSSFHLHSERASYEEDEDVSEEDDVREE